MFIFAFDRENYKLEEMELEPLCLRGMPKNACHYFYNKSSGYYYEYRTYDKRIRNVTYDFDWFQIRKNDYMEAPLVFHKKVINICKLMFC